MLLTSLLYTTPGQLASAYRMRLATNLTVHTVCMWRLCLGVWNTRCGLCVCMVYLRHRNLQKTGLRFNFVCVLK